MANFDIRTARNFNAYNRGGLLESKVFSILIKVAYVVLVLCLVLSFINLSSGNLILEKTFWVLSGLSLAFLFVASFLSSFYKVKTRVDSENIAESFDENLIEVINSAIKTAKENGFASVDPIILLSALEQNPDGKYMMLRCGMGLEKDTTSIIAEAISKIEKVQGAGDPVFPQQTLDVIAFARENAVKKGRTYISSGDIVLGLLTKSDVFKKLVFEVNLQENDVENVVEWYEKLKAKSDQFTLPFWEKPTTGGIGRDWSFGYTPTLNQFARDLNTEIEMVGEVHVYGRSREVEEIERVLAKSGQNNALLIGQHGIGKKSIVKGFVTKIVKGDILPSLKYNHVFQVDTGALLSGSVEGGEIAMRVKKVFNEAARAGNIILFFDNFHALVSKQKGVGEVNTAELIIPYLNGSVNVIGATTLEDFHKNIEANPGISSVFDRIEVKEPTADETVEILQEMIPFIEHRDGVFWPYQAIKELVRVCGRYIHDKPYPEKAIELLDEISVSQAKAGRKIILVKEIDELVSHKLEVPVAQAEGEEAKKLLNLEDFLHKRVIGQDEAIEAVASAMRRARAGIQSKQRPIGTFLFLGPTGVGKTETSKALAEAYFGSEKNMIRIDMSEFQEQSSVYRLIGSPPSAGSEGEKGQLTTAVQDSPFSLVLLDELEKAHKDILTLFLQVFDDGRLTDGTGKTVDFTNTIIIATSNAGSEVIREAITKNIKAEDLKKGLLDFLQRQAIFRPEFLNRFDEVVAFHPLTQDQIKQVAQLMLDSLVKTMAEKEIKVSFTDAAVTKLSQIGFDPQFGARPMRRAIQDKVENLLANQMLAGTIQRGASVIIDEKDI